MIISQLSLCEECRDGSCSACKRWKRRKKRKSEDDRVTNEEGIRDGERIMSVYKFDSKELWIITDAADEEGKRVTTFLLPEDY